MNRNPWKARLARWEKHWPVPIERLEAQAYGVLMVAHEGVMVDNPEQRRKHILAYFQGLNALTRLRESIELSALTERISALEARLASMPMAITLASLKRRVEQLARRHDLCPVHLVPLWCTCEQEWTGTEAEWEEVCELMDRLDPRLDRVHPSRVPCPRCQEWLYCDACCQAQLDGADLPADRCDQAEDARYQHLMSLMQPKPAAALAQDMTAVVQQAWHAQPSPVVPVAGPTRSPGAPTAS